MDKQTSFIIETLGVTAQAFDIFVTGPGNMIPPNEAIPVRCYQQKDKNLLAEFKPLSAGPHKIEVLHNREQVSGSPYVCQVPQLNINVTLLLSCPLTLLPPRPLLSCPLAFLPSCSLAPLPSCSLAPLLSCPLALLPPCSLAPLPICSLAGVDYVSPGVRPYEGVDPRGR